ncbi:hypothetical protein BVC80_4663g2 [Macleaya cordata]|uniref:Uncharacterized protein n=1 Tax=Macleaya cordata TaxID=56857 RepID=A0A200PMJ7_MACCD|nr:hypothetical protein BVC80_4663g2 [Macleaya cordata]
MQSELRQFWQTHLGIFGSTGKLLPLSEISSFISRSRVSVRPRKEREFASDVNYSLQWVIGFKDPRQKPTGHFLIFVLSVLETRQCKMLGGNIRTLSISFEIQRSLSSFCSKARDLTWLSGYCTSAVGEQNRILSVDCENSKQKIFALGWIGFGVKAVEMWRAIWRKKMELLIGELLEMERCGNF